MIAPLELAAPCDVVVVGSGLAGLVTALRLAPRRVRLLTKTDGLAGGATRLAQGGIAAALGPDDSPELHAEDTLEVSAGIADPAAVSLLVHEAREAIELLERTGVRFDRDPSGVFALAREGAHRRRRILHAGGDRTGEQIARGLAEAVGRAEHVEVMSGTVVEELLLSDGRVAGVLARHRGGRLALHPAGAVVLATGGVGRVYSWTTNPPEATGDGLALAARGGAVLADLEFVQFHPTALDAGLDPMPLLSEALRGEGARVVDARGRPLLEDAHPLGDLAPRDVAARAIFESLERGAGAFLDARGAAGGRLAERFPGLMERCLSRGLDPRNDLLPVRPAAHFHMGGIAVDSSGRSSLAGLWACGEVAATGAHGANRLASNSLLEAAVFGMRVAADIHASAVTAASPEVAREAVAALGRKDFAGRVEPAEAIEARLRRVLWEGCGLFRTEEGLARSLLEIETLEAGGLPSRLQNLVTVAHLIARAASIRKESRGAHCRLDWPEPDPAWQRRLFLRAAFEDGRLRDLFVEENRSPRPSDGVSGLCG
jgi:L-aspartate oxidase